MTVYNKQTPSVAGATPTYVAAAAGDAVQNPVGGILIVKTGGTGTTVTLATPGNLPNGDAYPDKAIVIGTSTERWIGPLGPEYVDANGQLQLSWSSTTTVTWACMQPS